MDEGLLCLRKLSYDQCEVRDLNVVFEPADQVSIFFGHRIHWARVMHTA